MNILRWIIVISVGILAWYIAVKVNSVPPMPKLDPNPWWGPGHPREQNINVRPFKINIPKEDVDDLKRRLSMMPRVTPSLENSNFTYGVNSAATSVILNYWTKNYDWNKGQQRLNAFPHFKTRIEGLDIHFLKASPLSNSGKIVRPLLLIHGWPGSVVEFLDVLPLLTTPRADSAVVFEVICPSIPGYAFSEPAARPGMDILATSQIFVKLMTRLGHDKFYVQGGDWGSTIANVMSTMFPDRVIGMHVNHVFGLSMGPMLATHYIGSILPPGFLVDSTIESKWYPFSKFYTRLLAESGYMHIQASKPDTLGVALNSSPQGLAAYILEKFSTWTNEDNINKKDGGLLDPNFPIALDKILDNICVYWFTNSITTSMRFYSESVATSFTAINQLAKIPTSVPTGIAQFLNDQFPVPRRLASTKFTNIVTFTYPSKAGHFPAMEDPKNFAQDFLNFVAVVESKLPSTNKSNKS